METEGLLPPSQQLVTGPYSDSYESIPHLSPLFL